MLSSTFGHSDQKGGVDYNLRGSTTGGGVVTLIYHWFILVVSSLFYSFLVYGYLQCFRLKLSRTLV